MSVQQHFKFINRKGTGRAFVQTGKLIENAHDTQSEIKKLILNEQKKMMVICPNFSPRKFFSVWYVKDAQNYQCNYRNMLHLIWL